MSENSTRRAATCAGPTSAAAATASSGVAPARSSRPGKCAAIAPVTNQPAANTKASRNISRYGFQPAGGACAGGACAGRSTAGTSRRLSGSPRMRLSAAQTRQVSRQPSASFMSADNGQLTVDAKPANSVIPVIGPRARGRRAPSASQNPHHRGRAPSRSRAPPRPRRDRLPRLRRRASETSRQHQVRQRRARRVRRGDRSGGRHRARRGVDQQRCRERGEDPRAWKMQAGGDRVGEDRRQIVARRPRQGL